jgi:solute carrier family 25 (mitochondrial oxoglutarate transporter), member 11
MRSTQQLMLSAHTCVPLQTYTTLRLGLYDIGKKLALDVADRRGLGGLVKFGLRQLVGAVSGAIASFLSCPVEVCLVRMQADGKLPPNKRRNYKNIVDALLRIGREEGVTAYWTGARTTVIR